MTDFGRLHLAQWFRIRAGLFSLAFLLTLAVTQLVSIPPFVPLLLLFAGDALLPTFGPTLAKRLGARQTTTLALVSNELATNSLRHGFNNGAHTLIPTLEFSLQQLQRQVACAVSDTGGVRLPDAFAIDTAAGLGLNLVRTLVEKDLHGHFTLQRDKRGTRAEIRFRPDELQTDLPWFAAPAPVLAAEEHAL